jgi:hypothetical protein
MRQDVRLRLRRLWLVECVQDTAHGPIGDQQISSMERVSILVVTKVTKWVYSEPSPARRNDCFSRSLRGLLTAAKASMRV